MMQGGIVLGLWVAMASVTATMGSEEETVRLELPSEKLPGVEYSAPNLFPESFDWDAKYGRFLVGSTAQGKLVTITVKGVVQDFVKDEDYSGAAILGVKVDIGENRVFAVVHDSFKEPPLSALVAYDLDSKKRLLNVILNDDDETNVLANDVAVDEEGHAYVTNTFGNTIWKITAAGNKSVLAELPQQAVEVEMLKDVGANGIAHHDGRLVVGQSNSGALLMVNLANGKVQVVRMKEEALLPGADGLAFRSDGSLVVVSTHTAWLLRSRDYWRSASVVDHVPLDEAVFTTSAAVDDMRVFLLNSHFPESTNGTDREIFRIEEIVFPTDSENNPRLLLLLPVLFAIFVLAWRAQLSKFNHGYTKKRN